MTVTMSFIQSSWPKPIYLKQIPSYDKKNIIKMNFKEDNIDLISNISINNTTNYIIPRSNQKYVLDQFIVCAMVWWIILGGVKNSVVRFFTHNGTRY